jgi:hypothetical protein
VDVRDLVAPDVVRAYLMYVLLPIWIATGLGDWWCHRRSKLELTTGVPESISHLAMLVQVGVATLAALFLEINAAIIALAFVALVLHAMTAWWDVRFAVGRRHISAFEQHMHAYLEVLPLMAVSCMVFLHWSQFVALFSAGDADFSLRLKDEPLPTLYLSSVLIAVLLLNVIPFVEELWRALRARDRPTFTETVSQT